MSTQNSPTPQPVGYDALIARFKLQVVPHWHHSQVGGVRQSRVEGGSTFDTFRADYATDGSLGAELEFALKYDGTNLAILAAVFERAEPEELLAYIHRKPAGKYARRLWYLYELLTGRRLALEDLAAGNYVDLLDPGEYFTAEPVQIRRHRINDNLLGDVRFCPMVRRTAALRACVQVDLPGKCQEVLAAFPREVLRRALSYLYTRETKSSFEIESVALDAARVERFVALLHLAERDDFFAKGPLIDLQNRIADPRFAEADYRRTQNYVGESIAYQRQRVHFVPPKPEDLAGLMNGLYAAHARLSAESVHPVVHAAAVAFGFVYLHPFEDGNGRIHRFLIHNILARRRYTPAGLIFPVSAAMLQDPAGYDAALEAFSAPLLPLLDYSLDDAGHLTVATDSSRYYRYPDLTVQTEALFGFVQRAIERDLADELRFLQHYDACKSALQAIVDLPDRALDLFIRLCVSNGGKLSATKRAAHFSMLTAAEIERLQEAVRQEYFG